MNRSRAWWWLSLVALVGLVLSACAPAATPTPQVIEKEKVVEKVVTPTPVPRKVLRLNLGPGDVPTLDPSLATDTSSIQIIELAFVGLTRQNEETAAVEPGMAERWEVSPDGKVWTFYLRRGIPWVRWNGQEVEQVKDEKGDVRYVTAYDFWYGAIRTLKPETGGEYAYVPAFFIEGAAEFNEGTITEPEKVGIKVIDDYTIQFTLKEPVGFFANIAGLWMLRAQPQWLIEEKGDRWTETGAYHSYGPYVMKEWVHDSHIVMVANPFWPDNIPSVPKPKIEEIVFRMLDTSAAFAEYEAGNLDVAGVPLPEMDRVKADPQLSKELHIAPILCTYYYGFNVTKPPFDDARMRLAFSLAVDRQAIVENVTKGGQEPAQWFSRPGLQAAPTLQTHPNLGVKYDPERAKQLFQEVLNEKYGGDVKNLPPITLMVNQVEGHIKIAEAIQQMWKEVLGVDVKLETQEWKVYLNTLNTDPPQVWRLGWCQDYPHASNFLKDVFYSTSDNNHTKWGNPEFDRLVDQALRETDESKARELYAQAEDILVAKDAAIIPIYWYTSVAVTKPYVKRTFSVLGGLDHIEKWDIQQ